MTFHNLGPDTLTLEIEHVLRQLKSGKLPGDIETQRVDIKEEPGRRSLSGELLPGQSTNERASEYLTQELACLANSRGAGALILGVSDTGQLIGTELNIDVLRHRIYELSQRRLTADITELIVDGVRLLVLRVPEALEPVTWRGKIRWRVGSNCVEVDPSSWWSGRMYRTGYDWSAEPSGYGLADVRPAALDAARNALAGNNGDSDALEKATDADFLRRLNVMDNDSRLTNAGALLFVTTPESGIDYIRRDYSGADSTIRIRTKGPLLTQLAEVELAANVANRQIHIGSSFVISQVRALPTASIREAIVNGLVHRDWRSPSPTIVEHVGDTLTVTSPGGLMPGVSVDNIITHPSTPRYRSLAETMARLNLAEREGIGIDRMVAAGIALGHEPPVIYEIAGPHVRVVLLGGPPDHEWMKFLSAIEAPHVRTNVDMLLILDELVRQGWVDGASAARRIQKDESEAETVLIGLSKTLLQGAPLLVEVQGVPPGASSAWRLSDAVRSMLSNRLQPIMAGRGRLGLLIGWVRARGRVSSTEAADLLGVSTPTAGKQLQELEAEGLVKPSRPGRRGSGFHYVLADGEGAAN